MCYGITLALQNHRPVITDHRDVLRMVREVDSPYLKVCLDAGIMPDRRPEAVRQAALDVGPLQVLSHFGGEFDRGADGIVQPRRPTTADKTRGDDFNVAFVRALREIGYHGYIGYELCHPLPVVNGQTVGIEYADENARLACAYMRRLINTKCTAPGNNMKRCGDPAAIAALAGPQVSPRFVGWFERRARHKRNRSRILVSCDRPSGRRAAGDSLPDPCQPAENALRGTVCMA
jgi:hypothetical protein